MLPPPSTSRQASYAHSLPRECPAQYPSFRHSTDAPLSSPSTATFARSDDRLNDATDFEHELEQEEGMEVVGKERGLDETLEKIGFGRSSSMRSRDPLMYQGAYQYRLLVRIFARLIDHTCWLMNPRHCAGLDGCRIILLCRVSVSQSRTYTQRAQISAVILPRIQIHFDLSSQAAGLLSASSMAGVSYTLPPPAIHLETPGMR